MLKFLFTLLLLALFSFSFAGTVVVTTTNDSGAGSLRASIASATSGDTIRFSPSLIAGGSDTLLLSSTLLINKPLIIKGLYNSTDSLFISGGNKQILIVSIATSIVKNFYFDSVCLINGRATKGAAIQFRGEELSIKNSLIANNICTGNGGVIYSEALIWSNPLNTKIILENSKIIGNTAFGSSVGIYSYSDKKSIVTLKNSAISNNNNTIGGDFGGIYSYSRDSVSLVSVKNSSIENNTGVGIKLEDGYGIDSSHLIIDSSSISNNSLYGLSSDLVNIKNSFVGNNGTIGIIGSDVIVLKTSIFNNGSSRISMRAPSLHLLIEKSELYQNRGQGFGGGAISVSGSIKMTINDTKIHNNISGDTTSSGGLHRGGGVYIRYSNNLSNDVELTIKNSEIKNNHSTDDGGGIYIFSNTLKLNIDKSLIGNNRSINDGGGVYIKSPNSNIEINNSTIDSNYSKYGKGGGIAGIMMSSGNCDLSLNKCNITNNSSSLGAGIYTSEDSYVRYMTSTSSIKVKNSNIKNNLGTGIYGTAFSSIIEIEKCNIEKNNYWGVYNRGKKETVISIIGSSLINNSVHSISDTNSFISINSSTYFNDSSISWLEAIKSKANLISEVDINNSTIYSNEQLGVSGSVVSVGSWLLEKISLKSSLLFCDSGVVKLNSNSIQSLGNNFFTDTGFYGVVLTGSHITDSFNIDSSKLLLGSLQNNGGITLSMMPDSGSILINNGNPIDFSNAQNWAVTDSRRDAGAVERTCFNTGYDTIISCNSYISPSGRHIWHISGIYTDSIFSTTGCDSLISIDLKVNSTRSNIFPTACNNYISQTGNQYFVSGLYYDTLINTVGCDSIIEINLIINHPDTSVTLINPNSLSSNDSLATYQWLDCNNGGSIIINDTNRVLNPYLSGAYSVELTVNGCKDTSSCYSIIGYGLGLNEDYLLNQVLIYPNPNSGIFTLQLNKGLNVDRLFITDINGRLIKEITPQKTLNYEISFEGASGIYFLNLVSENERRTLKLVKE